MRGWRSTDMRFTGTNDYVATDDLMVAVNAAVTCQAHERAKLERLSVDGDGLVVRRLGGLSAHAMAPRKGSQ